MDYDFWRPDLIYIPGTKQNGGLLLRHTCAAATHLLKQTADCKALQSQID